MLMILRRFARRRSLGRFLLTFLTVVFWLAFIVLLGFVLGYTAGERGVSILKLLHITR
ncbi:hypothetical protein [Alicyclobacillus fodiniaquatilis]|uniref:DNA-directed RNA polymerase subunit beta n=1 Tax=Alicyclobacillus fodiniaquatilis TaxID=1661150 RepID=A0ABW4JEK7_9BACL